MYVCMYLCMHVCMYVCMYVFMCFIVEINVGEEIQGIIFTKAKNDDTFASILMCQKNVSHP